MRRAALLVALALTGCRSVPQAREATGDAARDLRVAVEHAQAALPLMRLTCAALRKEDERVLCAAIVGRVEGALPKALDVLARVDACAGQDDEPECIRLAVDGANVILRELQGEAPAPAPAESAAP